MAKLSPPMEMSEPMLIRDNDPIVLDRGKYRVKSLRKFYGVSLIKWYWWKFKALFSKD